MSAIIESKSAMRRLGTKAQDVVNDDTLTMAEKKTNLEALSAELKSHEAVISLHEQANRLMNGGDVVDTETAKTERRSLGAQIVSSDAFRNAVSSKGSRYSFATEIGTKATVAEGTTISSGQLNGNAGVLALPNYLPGITDLRYAPLGVGELFAQGTTSSPLISYVKQSAQTLGAAGVAEAGTIGSSDATFARVNEQVGKIASTFKITDEMLQDSDQIESFLSNMLVKELLRAEEDAILNGAGYPTIAGVLGRSGLATSISAGTTGTIAAPSKLIEAIFKQVTAIRTTAFVEPDAIVINPIDWQYIRLAKDAQGQYYAGGPFTGAYGNGQPSNVDSLWGIKVVTSPRIASGTALVGGFNEGGQLFRRQGVTLEMTNSDASDFKSSIVTVRAETRSALAVYRPGAFGTVTVTWA